MRVAVPITLTADERRQLKQFARGRSTPARMVLRAKIVLQAAAGKRNNEIAEELETQQKTVGLWRKRFAEQRIEILSRVVDGRTDHAAPTLTPSLN